jgi:trigger factor
MSSTPLLTSPVEFQQTLEPNCVLRLDVKASHELSLQAHKEAVKEVNKARSISGFRKGKAPDALVLKHFPQEIEHVWKEKLAQIVTNECLKTAPKPLSKETRVRYDVTHPSLIEASTVIIRYEVDPVIPELDLADFKFEDTQKPEVNQEKVDETIRQTQYFFATWETIDDRAVELEDCVVLDVDVINEGQRQTLFRQTRFEVNSKNMAEWMMNAVIGMKPGDEKDAKSVADKDASAEEKALFQPKDVILKLVSVQKASLPFLDNEFAKKVGAESVEDLREKVTKILSKQSDDHVLSKEREQITQFILNKYPFELPHSQVEREVRFRLKQLFDDPHFGPYWSSLNEKERQNSIIALEDQSKKAIRMFYLARKILNDKKIKITQEDMQKAPIEPLEVLIQPNMGGHNPNAVDMNNAESYSRIVLEKAQDALIADARNLG